MTIFTIVALPLLLTLFGWVGVDRTWYVDSTQGNDNQLGTEVAPLKTLGAALARVQPGDTILLAEGIYAEEVETVTPGKRRSRITIAPQPGTRPILDGREQELDGPRLVHSYYTLRGIEVRNFSEGVRLEGVTGVLVDGLEVHHIKNECLRVRFGSTHNTIRRTVIHTCGTDGNGEGIYVGTAPEQRSKYNGKPDPSERNDISDNEIYNVEEGIDLKEDSSHNTVSGNRVYHASDPESGAINIRSDDNEVTGNLIFDNAGSGIRFGGDVAKHPKRGARYHYGVNNVVRSNVALNNRHSDYKFMHGPQRADCTNMASGLGAEGSYYFGSDVTPFLSCQPSLPLDLARYVTFHRDQH